MNQDPSQLSDAQLLAIIGQSPAQAPSPAPQQQPRQAAPSRPAPAPLSGVQGQIESILPGVRITSARRDPARNKAVGGAPNSYHLRGQAFDLAPPPGMSMADLERQLRQSGLPFAELLNEGDHIHVAWEGEAVDAPQSAPSAEALSDAELLALAGAPQDEPGLDLAALARGDLGPEEVEIGRGLLREGGNLYTLNQDNQRVLLGSEAEWDALSPADREIRFSQAMSGRSQEFMAEYDAAKASAENVPAWLANLSQGNSLGLVGEAVAATNFLAPMTEGVDRGTAYEAARAAWQDRQGQLVQDDPLGSVGMQMLGGLATPGVKGSGDWIGATSGAQRVGRAAAVGGAYGGAAGLLGSDEADLGSRVQGGLLGLGTGAATGGILDAGAQRAFAGASRRVANPSPQRRLSRQGVDLTPGQMAGGTLRRVENGLTSLPIMGDSIREAQRRGLSSFDNVATNVSLADIGVNIADTAGRAGVRSADDALRQAYSDALAPVSAVGRDAIADAALAQARRPDRMTPEMNRNLNAILDNTLAAFDNGPVDGQAWKQVDSELAAAIRSADRGASSDPAQRILRDRLIEAREAVGGMLERTNPDALAAVRAADKAFAKYRLVAKASSDVASAGRGGDASPATLNRAVVGANNDMRVARGESPLQDLTDDAMQVMPSNVPDSGSPLRGLLSIGAVGGGATVAGADPLIVALTAGGLLGGSALYSGNAQKLANAIYRATDRQTATSALGELQRLAGRNPALQPYYQAAVEAVQRAFPSQSPEPAPRGQGLLAPTTP